jgi:hypothetical protein
MRVGRQNIGFWQLIIGRPDLRQIIYAIVQAAEVSLGVQV